MKLTPQSKQENAVLSEGEKGVTIANGRAGELALRQAAYIQAASSDNTRRTYQSAVRHFLKWGGVLPASENQLRNYLLAHAEQLNPRTLALRLTALSQWHHHQGFADPTAHSGLRKLLTGIQRVSGKPKKKAKALELEQLEVLVTYLDSRDELSARRDSALLQLGFFGGFRRSELVSLRVEHIQWEKAGIRILLPRSKTDQSGEGISKAIPYGEHICCAARALKVWLAAAGITQGLIFRGINQWQQVAEAGLHPASMNTILKKHAGNCGLGETTGFSSHSLRRGMATSAYRAGASFRDIKRQGGWRFDGTVHGYIEEADLFEENAMKTLLSKSAKGKAGNNK